MIDHFVRIHGRDAPSGFVGFSDAAIELLTEYDWPGNIREVRNLVERLLFIGPSGQVEPEDLIPHLETPPFGMRQFARGDQ